MTINDHEFDIGHPIILRLFVSISGKLISSITFVPEIKNQSFCSEIRFLKLTMHLHSIARGNGPPVILIHGMAASLHDWDYLVQPLSESGFSAYAVDLLGHGESFKPESPEDYHFQTIYQHLENWISNSSTELPLVMIGHSLGGILALRYTLDHPQQVASLVLIDPFYHKDQLSPMIKLINRRPGWGARVLQLVPRWLITAAVDLSSHAMGSLSQHARNQITEDYMRASPHILRIANTVPDLKHELNQIHQPTLVLWGEKDSTLEPNSFTSLVNELPNSRGKVIPGSGHQPHLSTPEVVNDLILDFLKSCIFDSAH